MSTATPGTPGRASAPSDAVTEGDPRAILLSADAPATSPWYLRRTPLVVLAVLCVVAIAVVTDLPTTSSHSANVAGAQAFIKEVNGDLVGCTTAVTQAGALRRAQLAHTLRAADLSNAVQFLAEDEDGCTADSPLLDDLYNIDEPGTSAHRPLVGMLNDEELWVADGLTVIGQVQVLIEHPASASAAAALASAEAQLRGDRAAADAQLTQADTILATRLVEPALPEVGTTG